MTFQDHARSISSSPRKQTSGDFLRYMLTPDRIPEFVIPSLGLLEEHRRLGKAKALSKTPRELEVSRNKIKGCPCFPPGSLLTCYSRLEMDLGLNDIPADSVTRAALSLPHLPKIITPYGFVSLGQSPQVAKEEALFFQFGLAPPRDPNPKEDLDPQGGHSNVDNAQAERTSINLRDHCPCHAQVVSQAHLSENSSGSIKNRYGLKLSDPGEGQDTDVFSKSSAILPTSCSHLDCPSLSLQKSPKTLFQKIPKKHSAHLGNFKVVKMYPTAAATYHPEDSKTWDMSKK